MPANGRWDLIRRLKVKRAYYCVELLGKGKVAAERGRWLWVGEVNGLYDIIHTAITRFLWHAILRVEEWINASRGSTRWWMKSRKFAQLQILNQVYKFVMQVHGRRRSVPFQKAVLHFDAFVNSRVAPLVFVMCLYPSVCPSVLLRIYQRSSHCTDFYEIWYSIFYEKSICKNSNQRSSYCTDFYEIWYSVFYEKSIWKNSNLVTIGQKHLKILQENLRIFLWCLWNKFAKRALLCLSLYSYIIDSDLRLRIYK